MSLALETVRVLQLVLDQDISAGKVSILASQSSLTTELRESCESHLMMVKPLAPTLHSYRARRALIVCGERSISKKWMERMNE